MKTTKTKSFAVSMPWARMIFLIQAAHRNGKKVGICGQAPSDYPKFAAFLIQEGIDSISLNPDSVVATLKRVAEEEERIG